MSLQQLDLEKRSKELDVREEYLKQREQLLEDGPLTIKIVEGTIKARENQLSEVLHEIDRAKLNSNKIVATLRADESNLQSAILEKKKELANISSQFNYMFDELKQLKEERKKSQEEHKADLARLREQEDLIAKVVEDGNLQIKNIQYQIEPLEDMKFGLQGEITTLETQKTDLIISVDSVQISLDEQLDIYQEKLAECEKQIIEANLQYAKIKEKTAALEAECEKRIMVAKEAEESLQAKQRALELQFAELQTEKRRWNSTKSLYGLE